MKPDSALTAFCVFLAGALAFSALLYTCAADGATPRDRILSALLSLPPYKDDRGPWFAAEKRRQLEIIADAVDQATREVPYPDGRQRLAAALIAKAYHETGLSMRIHRDDCRIEIGECDGGKSKGLWQQQVTHYLPPDRWARLGGLNPESTRFAAREAALTIRRMRLWCGPDMAAVFSAYGSGLGCSKRLKDAPQRVATLNRVLVML